MSKKILLTGSEGLIGKEIYKHLKKLKFKVTKIDLKLGHDLTNSNVVKKLMNENNDHSYLINLHGLNDHITKNRKKSNDELDHFDKMFRANVYSTYLTNKYFIEKSSKPKGIINFASLYAIQSPKHYIYEVPKDIFYVASKFSVIGLTKYYSSLFGKKLNINCIVNGGIETNQPKNFKKKMRQLIPNRRMMKVEDLFGVIELLLSDKSNYINGSSIVIDGGYSAW